MQGKPCFSGPLGTAQATPPSDAATEACAKFWISWECHVQHAENLFSIETLHRNFATAAAGPQIARALQRQKNCAIVLLPYWNVVRGALWAAVWGVRWPELRPKMANKRARTTRKHRHGTRLRFRLFYRLFWYPGAVCVASWGALRAQIVSKSCLLKQFVYYNIFIFLNI